MILKMWPHKNYLQGILTQLPSMNKDLGVISRLNLPAALSGGGDIFLRANMMEALCSGGHPGLLRQDLLLIKQLSPFLFLG